MCYADLTTKATVCLGGNINAIFIADIQQSCLLTTVCLDCSTPNEQDNCSAADLHYYYYHFNIPKFPHIAALNYSTIVNTLIAGMTYWDYCVHGK